MQCSGIHRSLGVHISKVNYSFQCHEAKVDVQDISISNIRFFSSYKYSEKVNLFLISFRDIAYKMLLVLACDLILQYCVIA